MAKTKYRFNPDTLNYDQVATGFKKRLIKMIPHVLSSVVLALILYFFVFNYFIDSPKERKLKRENKNLLTQYEILNKKMDLAQSVLDDLSKRDDNIYRTIFEAEPIPNTVREAGMGGINRYSDLEGYVNSKAVIETAARLDKILKKIEIQSKSYDEIIELVKRKEDMLASIPAIQPISNNDLTRIASGFGYRIHPIYKYKKMHYGMDFTAPRGTDVYVTGNGVVEVAKHSKRGYGNQVLIDHGYGYKTLYAHLNKIYVRPGQKVVRGEVIGAVGNTGLSTSPHLHYEVHYKGKQINPINFYYEDVTPEGYEKMIELANQNGQSLD